MKKLFFFLSVILFGITSGQKKILALDEARQLIYTKPEKAIKLAENVLKKTDKNETKIVSLIIIVNAEMFLERSRDVIDHCNLAIDLAKKDKNKYQEIKILSMLGSQYQTMMLHENAKKYLDRAENMMDSIKIPDSLYYVKGNLYNVKGMVFRDELNCEFALKYFDKGLKVYTEQDNSKISTTNQALINIQRGSCLLAEGQLEKAEQCFEQILKANFDIGYNRFYAEICLAEIRLKQQKYTEASQLLAKIPITDIAKEDPELSSVYYLSMANVSSTIGNMAGYQLNMEKYAIALASLNKKRGKMISQLIYDSDVKNEKTMSNTQRDYIYIAFSAVFSSLLLLFLLRKKLF
jgi:tetratricopeptide (TPR) repeat protein